MRMALGKKHTSSKGKRGVVNHAESLGLGFVRYNRGFGRKRVEISESMGASPLSSALKTPRKRCGETKKMDSERSLLEALPQDILIRILCGVEHDDLKKLIHVSKTINEATKIAKQWHFAYSTPSKTRAFRNSIDLDDSSKFDKIEAPNAPKQIRAHGSRINRAKLAEISVTLFPSPEKERWPKKELFVGMDMDVDI